MRVLIDAQLPKRLADFLISRGVDALHTLELPDQNKTTDGYIIRLAEQQDRIVITKDRDFWDNYILSGKPSKLLIVSTGNITNTDLITLFDKNLQTLDKLFSNNSVLELGQNEIIVHY